MSLEAVSALWSGDATRRCVVVRLCDASPELLFRLAVEQHAAAAVIVVPPGARLAELDSATVETLVSHESALAQAHFTIPIYFVEETPDLAHIVDAIEASDRARLQQRPGDAPSAGTLWSSIVRAVSASGYLFSIPYSSTPTPMECQVVNVQGRLTGALAAGESDAVLPTIAIVAHYDAFSVSPGRAHGADDNASGVVAVLALARLFSQLYRSARTHARYNFVFILTAAGALDHDGARHWIDSADVRLLDSLAFALCLDSIAQSERLYLHTARLPTNGTPAAGLIQALAEVFGDDRLTLIGRKINHSDPAIAWQHEQFVRRRVPSATLSGRHLPLAGYARGGGLIDVLDRVNVSLVHRNVVRLAEALARHIYGLQQFPANMTVFDGTDGVSADLVEAWMSHLASQARAQPLLTAGSALVADLVQTMQSYTAEVTRQTYTLDGQQYRFYGPIIERMTVARVMPAVFDAVLSLAIGAYLAALYAILAKIAG